jgi:hypothetical protein
LEIDAVLGFMPPAASAAMVDAEPDPADVENPAAGRRECD